MMPCGRSLKTNEVKTKNMGFSGSYWPENESEKGVIL